MLSPNSKWFQIFKDNPRQEGESLMGYSKRISEMFGNSPNAIRQKAILYESTPDKTTTPAPQRERTIEGDRQLHRVSQAAKETDRLYKAALSRIEVLESELEAASQRADLTTDTTIQIETAGKSEAICFAVLSDWHIEETITPESVNGMNEYNLDIATDRAKQSFAAIHKLLLREQSDQKIDKLVLGIIGDLISGNIHAELMENCSLRPMEAMIMAEELVCDGINYLLKHTKVDIDIVWRVGNHTRITKKVHISTESGNSLETYMFHHLKAYYRDNPRLKFFMTESYLQYTELFDGGYTICWQHGHAVKYGGGVGGITIPINKAISQWQKLRHADLYVMGHWHQFFDGGNFLINGSLIGYNSFAVFIKAGYEPPKQAFFTVNKKWMTKTATYPILFQ